MLPSAQERVKSVAARYKAIYFKKGQWAVYSFNPEANYRQLKALPSTATPEDVARITGNDSWTSGECCTECEEPAIVQVGQEPNYESATVYLCEQCVNDLYIMVSA